MTMENENQASVNLESKTQYALIALEIFNRWEMNSTLQPCNRNVSKLKPKGYPYL